MTDTGNYPKAPNDLKGFYELMAATRPVRSRLVRCVLDHEGMDKPDPGDIEFLRNSLTALQEIPLKNGKPTVLLDKERKISIDLGYETGELEKDILYLEQGEEALLDYMSVLHRDFFETVAKGTELLGGKRFNCLVSDRDGTTNNYCSRYLSSIQSVYNSVFLSRFARKLVEKPLFLTSAPLENGGIVQISVNPPGTFIYAASKGRECLDLQGVRHSKPVPPEKQKMLDELNRNLDVLLGKPEYEKFSFIGSGLQHKFGQTTVARQDIAGSIAPAESEAFLEVLRSVVNGLDPKGDCFRIEDTGLDVEIMLTIEHESAGTKDFDKGDGVAYLDESLGLDLGRGPNLVCGDTGSDVPMLQVAQERSEDTWAVFVTRKRELAERVLDICSEALIVPEPDILVTILGRL